MPELKPFSELTPDELRAERLEVAELMGLTSGHDERVESDRGTFYFWTEERHGNNANNHAKPA